MKDRVFECITRLQSERETSVLLYGSSIESATISILYKCLRRQGRVKKLDLVLCTEGGSVNVARRIALLLREYADELTILVPHKARSAGTLLCLSADRLVLGPMAELSPLDPQIGAEGPTNAAMPSRISAEEVRLFRQMAGEWFGVYAPEDQIQVLALVAQKIFPTSLSGFYRSELLMRQTALELLAYQLPKSNDATRQHIVETLVTGYHSHDYAITRTEAKNLGLHVQRPSDREEELLWNMQEIYQDMSEVKPDKTEFTHAMIAGSNFFAREVSRWTVSGNDPSWKNITPSADNQPHWEFE